MKPIAIFRHTSTEGPGYFATFLTERSLPWKLIHIDQGHPVPQDPTQFSGLAFMGGPMSVNDPLPWIPPVLELIRSAVRDDIPVIGHCLGGQLLSKALGGVMSRNPVKEIGWGQVDRLPGAQAPAGLRLEPPPFGITSSRRRRKREDGALHRTRVSALPARGHEALPQGRALLHRQVWLRAP